MSKNLSDLQWGTIDEGLAAGAEDLIFLTWEEAEPDKNRFPLDPDWPTMRMLEKIGALKAAYVWDGPFIAGHMVFMINQHIHSRKKRWAMCDHVYVSPEYRKGGLFFRMVRQAERLLGVDTTIVFHTKTGLRGRKATVGDSLRHLGYERWEETWGKFL